MRQQICRRGLWRPPRPACPPRRAGCGAGPPTSPAAPPGPRPSRSPAARGRRRVWRSGRASLPVPPRPGLAGCPLLSSSHSVRARARPSRRLVTARGGRALPPRGDLADPVGRPRGRGRAPGLAPGGPGSLTAACLGARDGVDSLRAGVGALLSHGPETGEVTQNRSPGHALARGTFSLPSQRGRKQNPRSSWTEGPRLFLRALWDSPRQPRSAGGRRRAGLAAAQPGVRRGLGALPGPRPRLPRGGAASRGPAAGGGPGAPEQAPGRAGASGSRLRALASAFRPSLRGGAFGCAGVALDQALSPPSSPPAPSPPAARVAGGLNPVLLLKPMQQCGGGFCFEFRKRSFKNFCGCN